MQISAKLHMYMLFSLSRDHQSIISKYLPKVSCSCLDFTILTYLRTYIYMFWTALFLQGRQVT